MKKLVFLLAIVILCSTTYAQKPDGAYSVFLDNGDDVVVPNTASIDISGPMTVEAWVYKDASSSPAIIMQKGNGSASDNQYLFMMDNIPRVLWQIRSSGAASHNIYSSNLAFDTWYHVVGTYNGTYMNLYVNGSRDGFVTANDAQSTETPLYIGGNHKVGGWRIRGFIDEARIYSRALSEAEIFAEYNVGLTGAKATTDQTNLEGYWDFECGSTDDNSVWYDKSGNSNHGTAYGGAYSTEGSCAGFGQTVIPEFSAFGMILAVMIAILGIAVVVKKR